MVLPELFLIHYFTDYCCNLENMIWNLFLWLCCMRYRSVHTSLYQYPYMNIKLAITHPWKVSTLSNNKTGLTQHFSPFLTTRTKYDGKHRDNSRTLRIRFWISVLQVVLPGKTTFNRLVSNTQANYFTAHLKTIKHLMFPSVGLAKMDISIHKVAGKAVIQNEPQHNTNKSVWILCWLLACSK
jgi:hypothetical protein